MTTNTTKQPNPVPRIKHEEINMLNRPQAIGQITSGAANQIEPRAFPNFQQRIAIAQEAAWASAKELSDLRSRLGVSDMHGQIVGDDPDAPEPGGEVDSLTRAIERLTDTVRDIRGLAETLNSKL